METQETLNGVPQVLVVMINTKTQQITLTHVLIAVPTASNVMLLQIQPKIVVNAMRAFSGIRLMVAVQHVRLTARHVPI